MKLASFYHMKRVSEYAARSLRSLRRYVGARSLRSLHQSQAVNIFGWSD